MNRRRLVPLTVILAALAAGIWQRDALRNWFELKSSRAAADAGDPAAAMPAEHVSPEDARVTGAVTAVAPLAEQQFPQDMLPALATAFRAYEDLRALLAADSIEGLGPRSRRLGEALEAAATATVDESVVRRLKRGAADAQRLGATLSIETARVLFGEVSATLIALAAADERLANGRFVFECPMAEGFNKWIQTSPGMANPYMGQKMLECGSDTAWTLPLPGELGPAHAHDDGEIAYHTCPMHPSVRQKTPGKCPICGMDLTPVTKHEAASGVVIIDAQRRQLIGVRTGRVDRREVALAVRAVGKVSYDEKQLVDVTLRYGGFIRKLSVNETGQRVAKGQVLFHVYSAEVYAAERDLLVAAKGAPALLASARERLRLLDVPAAEIERVLAAGAPSDDFAVTAPAGGYVVEKQVVEGAAIDAGMRLYRIANLDRVWVEAEVYESELPLVQVGQPVDVTLPYLPGQRFAGKVAWILPFLDGTSRTGRVRVELANPQLALKPDMYANVELSVPRGERLVVPESAVLYAGPRRLVFLDLGKGRLRPQEVQLGPKAGDFYEVLGGLNAGDEVVTSGNFLVAAESRLKAAEGQW